MNEVVFGVSQQLNLDFLSPDSLIAPPARPNQLSV